MPMMSFANGGRCQKKKKNYLTWSFSHMHIGLRSFLQNFRKARPDVFTGVSAILVSRVKDM